MSELSVRFDQTVNVSGANGSPVTLVNVNDGTVITTTHNESVVGGKTVMTLTFPSGPSVVSEDVIASSLADGSYQLRVHADSITAAANGNSLDGDGDGIGGDDYVLGGYDGDTLFRLYGDASGDGNVGLTDFAAFRSAFGSGPGNANFDSGLDANRDGNIGLTDFASFRSNFGSSPSAPARPAVIAEVMRTGSPASEPSSDSEFIVTINSPNSTDTTINYTVGGTATPGVDYDSLSGTATIIAGQTSVAIPVELINDPALEADETITIELTSSSVALSPTGTVASLTIIDGGAENQSPAFFAGQTLSLPGIVSLGGYVGRVPAYDPDGDELTYAISGGSLPVGLLSVDPDTGDLYLADAELLPQAGISGTVGFTATDPDGLVTTGTVSVDLPPLPETVDDDFRDAGSHRSGITFDMRPTSVSADGETLYTSLLKDDGNPLLPGETLDDVEGGYLYGTFQAGLDGVLTYTPNETLYQDQFFGFSEDFFLTGVSRLQRPEQTLVLLAAAGSSGAATAAVPPASGTTYKRLAERKATPRLTNTQPVGIADGFFSFDQGILTTRPVFVSKDDLISIDVSQWFIDPDGDEILATTAFTGGGSDTVEIDTTSNPSKVLIDVVGDEIPFIFTTRFEQANVTIYIGDHPFSNTGPELSIPLQNFGDSFPVYDVPEGITYVDNTDRSDVGPTGIRDFGSDPWQQRFNDYSLTTTTFASGNDLAQAISVGSASIDLTTGNAKVAQPLPLADAFDDLSVPLGGLIYSGDLVDNKSLAKVIVEVPGDESRDIDRFDVTVELADHFAGNASSPLTRNYTFNIALDDQDQDQADQVRKFELTVPLVGDSADVLDSGVFGYQVKVVPHFVSTSTDPADRPITLRSSGRVAVVKQTTVTPSDFGNSDSSYSQFAPEFSDGWQLAGLPRFILDRGNIQSGTFENDPGSIAENSIPQAIIQFPGSDKLSIFRGTPAATGQPYSFLGSTFTPVDLEFGTVDADEFGTLDLSTSNVFTYTDGSGTQYQFERFNMASVAGKSGDPTPQFLVTKITPPDGSGLVIDYLENDGSDATPSVNNTGTANDGPLRINSINALRSTADSGSLTFQYNTTGAVKRVDKIVFGDGREILLDYDGDLLDTITQSTSAGEEDILHGFGYTTVGTGAGETDRPMIATITHAHLSPTDTLILDDKTELTYDDGGIVTATHGIAADNPTVTTLETFWSQKESIRAIAADVSELPSGREILPGDNEALLRATSILTIRTAAGDLQAYDEQSSTAVSAAGSHVTRHHLDERGNVIITDRVFDPAADPSSDDEVIRSRTKTRYDHFDNPVKLTDAVGRETTMLYDYTYPTASNVLGLTTHAGTVRHLPTLIKSPAGIEQIRRESTILAAMGAPIETIDVVGRRSTYVYDAIGKLTIATDVRDGSQDRVTTTTFDTQTDITLEDFNRPASVTSPLNLVTTFDTFDSVHKRLPNKVTYNEPSVTVAGVTVPGRTWTTETTYDSFGYIDTITTKEVETLPSGVSGPPQELQTAYEEYDYDQLGRVIAMRLFESSGGIQLRDETYRYDSLGRMTVHVDGRGATHRTDYDTAGRVARTILAEDAQHPAASLSGSPVDLEQVTTFEYFADGSLKEQTLPDDTTVLQFYDPVIATPLLLEQSPSLATSRIGSSMWTVTDGVFAGSNPNEEQVTRADFDELGRVIVSADLLIGTETASYYYENWNNAATDSRFDINLGSDSPTPSTGNLTEVSMKGAFRADGYRFRSQSSQSDAVVYTQDVLGQIGASEVKNSLGLINTFDTDSIGNVIGSSQSVKTIGQPIQERDTVLAYNQTGRSTAVLDAEGRSHSVGQNVVSVLVDPDGNGPMAGVSRSLTQTITTLPGDIKQIDQVDAAGQVIQSINPLGGITTYSYNLAGDLLSTHFRDPTVGAAPERHQTFVYDDLGRQRESITWDNATAASPGADSVVTKVDYFLPGQGDSLIPTTANLPVGLADSQEVRHAQTNSEGGVTVTAADSIGQTTLVVHPDPVPSAAGTQPRQWDIVSYDYDSSSQTVTTTVSSGEVGAATPTRVTASVVSAHGRLLAENDDLGGGQNWSTMVYDNRGNQLRMTDATGNATKYTYDGEDRVTSVENALGKFRRYTYNSAGEVHVATDRNSDTRTFLYDELGRVVNESWGGNAGTNVIVTGYDLEGRVDSLTDSFATINMTFDDASNMLTSSVANLATGLNITSTQTFDAASNRKTLTMDAGGNQILVNAYSYDALHRLESVFQYGGPAGTSISQGNSAVFTYTDSGRLDTIDRRAGGVSEVFTDYDYNDRGQVFSLDHTSGAGLLASYTLTYDDLARVDTFTSSTDGTADYTYDGEGQLETADYSYQSDENYNYDDSGNRTGGGYVTTSDNRTTADGDYTYTYDDEGQRTSRTELATGNVTTYTWDARHRLTAVTERNSGGTLVAKTDYTYAPDNTRIAQSIDADGNGTTETVRQYANEGMREYDGGAGDQVAAVLNASGQLTNRYLHGPMIDQVLADEQFIAGTSTSETLWTLGDHQGTIRDIATTNSGGTTTVVNHRTFDAFGSITSETNSAVDTIYAFHGREYDAIADHYYYRARYYDPQLGQFISQDPIGFEAGDPNLYRAVGNSPTNATDPSGLYDQGTHHHVTFMVARAAGWSVEEANNLAYYAFLPDRHNDFDAIHNVKTGLVKQAQHLVSNQLTPLFRKDITEAFMNESVHSLHGGDVAETAAWRGVLHNALKSHSQNRVATWEQGFLIHSLGDGYAHTKGGRAYAYPLGHGLDAHLPDLLGYRPSLFRQYVNDLFLALGGDVDNQQQFNDLQLIEDLAGPAALNYRMAQHRLDKDIESKARAYEVGSLVTPLPNLSEHQIKKMNRIYGMAAKSENQLVRQYAIDNFGYVPNPRSEPFSGKVFVDPQRSFPSTEQVFELYLPLVEAWKSR